MLTENRVQSRRPWFQEPSTLIFISFFKCQVLRCATWYHILCRNEMILFHKNQWTHRENISCQLRPKNRRKRQHDSSCYEEIRRGLLVSISRCYRHKRIQENISHQHKKKVRFILRGNKPLVLKFIRLKCVFQDNTISNIIITCLITRLTSLVNNQWTHRESISTNLDIKWKEKMENFFYEEISNSVTLRLSF